MTSRIWLRCGDWHAVSGTDSWRPVSFRNGFGQPAVRWGPTSHQFEPRDPQTHATRFVAVVAILAALAVCVPVQAQTPAADALRVRAEAGDAEAQRNLGVRYGTGRGVPEDDAEAQRLAREWDAAPPRGP
jgi:hypothetical protein